MCKICRCRYLKMFPTTNISISFCFLLDSDVATVSLQFIGVPRRTTVLKGRSAVLECAATGYPVPTIRWTKLGENSGEFHAPTPTYGIGNLNFSNIDESDEGQYECQATSNGRTISSAAWLLVRGT